MGHDDYAQKVQPAAARFQTLRAAMLEDLDPQFGGFGWWQGYLDPRRIALLSEYVVASVAGVENALLDAALQAQQVRELQFADDFWLASQWRQVERSGKASDEDYVRAARRGALDEKRARLIEAGKEHFFYHLAQALDRLAACVIGVGALERDIVRADWADVEKAADAASRGAVGGGLAPDGTDARRAQGALVVEVHRAMLEGPTDWLSWVLATRNNNAHRASQVRWSLIKNDVQHRPVGTQTPFSRQPGWPEVEAMLRSTDGRRGPSDLLIMEDPVELMDALLATALRGMAEGGRALSSLWEARKRKPRLLVQPGRQWKTLLGKPVAAFSGAGASPIPPPPVGSIVRVSPENGRRLLAAKVLDADADFWRDT